jgi:hypothetical protein
MRTNFRSCSKGPLAAVGLLALMVLSLGALRTATAAGEQNGRIKGSVRDAASGAALPSVTVVTTSKAMIGGARTVLTDDLGRYEIGDLPPGVYTVEVSYPGMVPHSRTVEVRPGVTVPLHIDWASEEAGVQAVKVTSGVALTKPDSTQTGTVLQQQSLAKLPTGRSYQSVAQLVPGVSGGANPNVKGGMNLNNRYMIDGLEVTDPVTQTFSANLSFDATGAVDVLTGGMEAQYNSLGGIINVVSVRGTQDWTANASLYLNHQELSALGNYGPNIYNYRQPFNDNPAGPTSSYQANMNVGGPLVKRHLWFNLSYELRLAESSLVKGPPLGGPPYNIQHPSQTSTNHLARVHLTYAPSQAHRVTLMGATSPGSFNNVEQDNFRLGVAENHQDQNSTLGVLTWDYFITNKVNTTLQLGVVRQTLEFGPQGRLGEINKVGCDLFKIMDNCTYDPMRAQHTNENDGTTWYQGDAFQGNTRYRVQIDPSVSIRGQALGSHDFKAGFQLQYISYERDVQTPGGGVFNDLHEDGLLLEEGLCNPMAPDPTGCFRHTENPDFKTSQKGYGAAFFIQDRWWTPISWLTVVPGFRIDYGRSINRNDETVTSLLGLGPRLGLIGDVTRDGRTILFAYYGRHTEVLSLLAAANVDAQEAAVSVEREWNPTTRRFDTEVSRSGGPGGLFVDKNAKTPYKDEVSVGARREIVPGAVVTAEYTYNRLANMWAAVERNRIWDPTGVRVVRWADPMKEGLDVYEYTTPEDNYRIYHGVSLGAEGRPSPNWDFGTSWTMAWNYGHNTTVFGQVSGLSGYDNVRQKRFFDGYVAQDLRHYLRAYGSYTLLRQLSLGANFGYFTGTPFTKTFWNQTDGGRSNYRSPLGTEPGAGNDQKTISEFRLPDRAFLDLRLVWNILPQRFGHRLNAIVDVFNVLNTRSVTGVVAGDLPNFGQVTTRQAPFRAQLAINYAY